MKRTCRLSVLSRVDPHNAGERLDELRASFIEIGAREDSFEMRPQDRRLRVRMACLIAPVIT